MSANVTSKRQLAMVMDLNKCIGCQTCTVACKTQWTNRNGRDYSYDWVNEHQIVKCLVVPEYMARYALNMTATTVLFLVEAHEAAN